MYNSEDFFFFLQNIHMAFLLRQMWAVTRKRNQQSHEDQNRSTDM